MALSQLVAGLQLNPMPPRRRSRDTTIPHAPVLTAILNEDEKKQALKNALRYFPPRHHSELANEFMEELNDFGHIYMYRFIPCFEMRAYPISEYPCKSIHTAGIMHMIMNNLDKRVAQYPHELVTYGGNGQVFSNWAQFWITMKYLSEMTEEQTLVMCSGHPQGLFPSSTSAPRVVITNGMVIPNYSSKREYDKMFALGVTMYGQMTAGSYCYIGPQGIVHGTTLTIMNAGRKYLSTDDLAGKVLLTSGLGGMSGAQAKAAVIAGCVGVIAEMDEAALSKRYQQGWLLHKTDNLEECVSLIKKYRKEKSATSIGFLGGIVELWERIVEEYENTGELLVEMGSDQTSCHNPYGGGYYPAGMSFEESQNCLVKDPRKFKDRVQQSDIFSLGFGPFRWVCTSGKDEDLKLTDALATQVLENLIEEKPKYEVLQQYQDNLKWIRDAGKHCLVVGSKARILYADCKGRIAISCAFNEAVKEGRLSGPVIISRDHHDVSGTDSPFRETSNVYDGSSFCADMAVQNCIGDSFRGATWVAIHNGGGVGWGEVINGGFGLVLDGSREARRKAETMLHWDVNNGVARRAWCGNTNAFNTIKLAMASNSNLKVTLPNEVDDEELFKSGDT